MEKINYRENLENIGKELLVDLLSSGTCFDYLVILAMKSENHLDEKYDKDYLENRCLEDKWADRLLNGGHIVALDYEDYDEEKKQPKRYELTLEDFKKGLIKARDGEAETDWYDFTHFTDDDYTCNNLLQIIIYGEIIYDNPQWRSDC